MQTTDIADSILVLEDVCYEVEGNTILSNIDVKISKTGITGIIGPSGSGKSTFLRILNKLISPTKGNLYLEGINYNEIETRFLRKRIALVQQKPYLFPNTVEDNLKYGPRIWDIEKTEKDYQDLLERVALPTGEFLHKRVRNLSLGEQQRVNFARSLANQPQILLLDEPTSSLDIISEEILENTIKELSTQIKIIIVTHSLEQTRRLTDRLLFINQGMLIEKKSSQEFFHKYNEDEIRTLFKLNNKRSKNE
jgi:putative ABC transport system ATP-binding protein